MLAPKGREDPESLRGNDYAAEESEPEAEPTEELASVARRRLRRPRSATREKLMKSAEAASRRPSPAEVAEPKPPKTGDRRAEAEPKPWRRGRGAGSREEPETAEAGGRGAGGEEPETAEAEVAEPIEEPEAAEPEVAEPKPRSREAEEPEAGGAGG